MVLEVGAIASGMMHWAGVVLLALHCGVVLLRCSAAASAVGGEGESVRQLTVPWPGFPFSSRGIRWCVRFGCKTVNLRLIGLPAASFSGIIHVSGPFLLFSFLFL